MDTTKISEIMVIMRVTSCDPQSSRNQAVSLNDYIEPCGAIPHLGQGYFMGKINRSRILVRTCRFVSGGSTYRTLIEHRRIDIQTEKIRVGIIDARSSDFTNRTI